MTEPFLPPVIQEYGYATGIASPIPDSLTEVEAIRRFFLPPVMSDVVIDLSHWNTGAIDFAAVKASGVAAVILKATQGSTFTDPTFKARANAAMMAGLLVGAYHFLDESFPSHQAAHFLEQAYFLPILALDLEPQPPTTEAITIAERVACIIYGTRGRWPIIYTGRYEVPGASPILAQCPLWLAEYGSRPICPPGWTRWELHQYTDGKIGNPQPVPGVGFCNRSVFAGTLEELRAWWTTCGGGP